MSNIYYDPEKHGLRTVGEVEWSEPCYDFNLTVVWQDVDTGAYYYASDSGCSCPSPFEDYDRTNITRVERTQDLIDGLAKAKADNFYRSDDDDEVARVDGQIGELIAKVGAR